MRYFLIILISFGLLSCSTTNVSPTEQVITEVISFDGNEQNGGIIDFTPEKGWIITPNAAKKYMALIKVYGKMFMPPLEKTGELIPYGENFILSQEKMVKFAIMNQRWKLDRK